MVKYRKITAGDDEAIAKIIRIKKPSCVLHGTMDYFYLKSL